MSQISGLRGLPHSASLSTAAVPRFGVQTDQEGQLAKVGSQLECRGPGLNPGSVWMSYLGPQFAHLYTGQVELNIKPGAWERGSSVQNLGKLGWGQAPVLQILGTGRHQ